jgi:3D (Asp-Asp-Asp) domain-containing protein
MMNLRSAVFIIVINLVITATLCNFAIKHIDEGLATANKGMHQLQQDLKELENINKQLGVYNQQLEDELKEKETFLKENKALRETVKSLSSRGNYPRNFSTAPEPDLLHNYRVVEFAGDWKITFYTPSAKECGNDSGVTASSKYVSPGYTIAVDTSYWELGTLFYIDGWGVVEAMDTGAAVNGRNRADLCIFDRNKALSLGKQQRKVWVIERR